MKYRYITNNDLNLLELLVEKYGYKKITYNINKLNENIIPNKVNQNDNYTELYYQSLNVDIKKTYQQLLIDGYLAKVERSFWDDYDKKSEKRMWQNNPLVFNVFSAYIKQFGNQPPVISISIGASNPGNNRNTVRDIILSIVVPNPQRVEFSSDELAIFVDNVVDVLQYKTNKAIKYMAKNWSIPNEYTDYNKFINL